MNSPVEESQASSPWPQNGSEGSVSFPSVSVEAASELSFPSVEAAEDDPSPPEEETEIPLSEGDEREEARQAHWLATNSFFSFRFGQGRESMERKLRGCDRSLRGWRLWR